MRKETTLRGENVKYISSSRLFTPLLFTRILHRAGAPKVRDMHPTVEQDVSNIRGSEVKERYKRATKANDDLAQTRLEAILRAGAPALAASSSASAYLPDGHKSCSTGSWIQPV